MWCHVMSYDVMWCHVMSCGIFTFSFLRGALWCNSQWPCSFWSHHSPDAMNIINTTLVVLQNSLGLWHWVCLNRSSGGTLYAWLLPLTRGVTGQVAGEILTQYIWECVVLWDGQGIPRWDRLWRFCFVYMFWFVLLLTMVFRGWSMVQLNLFTQSVTECVRICPLLICVHMWVTLLFSSLPTTSTITAASWSRITNWIILLETSMENLMPQNKQTTLLLLVVSQMSHKNGWFE